MSRIDDIRNIITLLESTIDQSTDMQNTEGSIDNTNHALVKFTQLLSKWQDKIDDLSQASSDGSSWTAFLTKNGVNPAVLKDVRSSARRLSDDLMHLQMSINQPVDD